jgi:hypothetical protein
MAPTPVGAHAVSGIETCIVRLVLSRIQTRNVFFIPLMSSIYEVDTSGNMCRDKIRKLENIR